MPDDSAPTSLGGDDLETWAALATVLEWLPPALDAQLARDSDLSHFEYGVLFALADAPERTLRMSVLAGYANSSLSRLSRAVSRLESRGWLRRSPDPRDGRSTLAALTPAGIECFEQATPGHVRTVHTLVLDPLTLAQRRHLREIARRITTAIRPAAGAPTGAPVAPAWRPSPPPASRPAPAAPAPLTERTPTVGMGPESDS